MLKALTLLSACMPPYHERKDTILLAAVGRRVRARLDQSALSHCKGSALAVAINISNECGVGDAHIGLAGDLHSKPPSI